MKPTKWIFDFFNRLYRNSITKYHFPFKQVYPVTSPYGWRKHPITGKRQFHNGIDIAAPLGTFVYSVALGKVITVDEDKINGHFIRVLHWDSKVSGYGHLHRTFVKEGDYVDDNVAIGECGETGRAKGVHLHLTIWKNRKRTGHIDPLEIIDVLELA